MSHRVRNGVVLLTTAVALAGCRGAGSSASTAPTVPVISTATVTLADTGHVLDTAFKPLAGVRVDVIDGPQAGASMVTGADGVFPLSGTFAWHVERDRRADSRRRDRIPALSMPEPPI